MGFHAADTVLVGGQPALVTSVSPNEITAIAPAAASGVSGSVDVEVDDLPVFYAAAAIGGRPRYDSGTGDALTLVTAPTNTVPIATAIPFTVTALGPDLMPAGGVSVTYTVVSGSATLACGLPVCTVTASGDGRATMNTTAADSTWSVVTASLSNGSKVQAGFAGGAAATLTPLSPQLSLAAGAVFTWTVQALALSNGAPASGQSVIWQSAGGGISAQGATAVLTNSSGIATRTLTVGPLAEGQTATINACLNGTNQCAAFTRIWRAAGVRGAAGRGRHDAEPRRFGSSCADYASSARHDRQPHDRRHGCPLSSPLCLGAALQSACRVPVRCFACRPVHDRHVRHFGHGHSSLPPPSQERPQIFKP